MNCSSCGDPDWLACAPGTVEQAAIEENVCWLRPAAEVALRCWCLPCWLLARQRPVRSLQAAL